MCLQGKFLLAKSAQRQGAGGGVPPCQKGPFGQVPIKAQSKNRLLGPPAKKGNGKSSLITLN